ncbi:hypothetical protein TIFTF001_001185 [Ficus carica]|uniref:Uncharacterized protein n=1 Tax=Ficus carica TaxID=3494 RepID=A0AA87Z620_FICCA|nr:hypothetical protein TIFTF001_001185 [Ficus carica]
MFILEEITEKAAPPRSLVTHLPGFDGPFPSKHYSGYINIDGNLTAGKNLFYYFVVSERNPAADPVVLWLNGGPGCSSFDGFVYEHGPFSFEKGKPKGSLPKLHLNSYTWTKVSNIIYLDSPVGVGLSYSKDPTKYRTGDQQTASDTHTFLLKWFEQFPEFLSNPFYISGESFAGIYVPTLASEVAKGIKNGEKPVINFKGYMVGNAVTDPKFDGNNALVPFAHGMALISDDIYEEARSACKGNYYSNSQKDDCNSKLLRVLTIVWWADLGFASPVVGVFLHALDGINIYDILEPCYHSPDADKQKSKANSSLPISFQQLGMTEKPLPVRKRMFGRAWPFEAPDDNVASTWLNDKAVREAIHAEPESVTGSWDLCTNKIHYYHDAGSMIPYHRNLTMQGYRALVFSGDHDMCVPFTGSQAWTRSLGYKIVDEWRPWISNSQIAGYLQGYDHNLTFLTIKGAGHTVPEYKPGEALDFYSRWLEGKPI